jgi:hypothetical protein
MLFALDPHTDARKTTFNTVQPPGMLNPKIYEHMTSLGSKGSSCRTIRTNAPLNFTSRPLTHIALPRYIMEKKIT